MPLSKESEELAEMRYELAVQRITQSYREKQRQIEFFTRTNFRREQEFAGTTLKLSDGTSRGTRL